jgi:hypothetical protein
VRRGENEAVLVVKAYVKQKRELFFTGEVFFLLIYPVKFQRTAKRISLGLAL